MKTKLHIDAFFSKFLFVFFAMSAVAFFATGCSSSSTSPGTTANVTATTDMENETISGIAGKFASPAVGPIVQSLTITHVRVLMSGLHLHVSDEAAAGTGNFTAQPIIADFKAGATAQTVATIAVPFGTYSQLIFDLHQLDNTADASLITNTSFADFVMLDRPTIIIDGTLTDNAGVTQNFSYRTSMVANLKPLILPTVIMLAEKSYTIDLRFDGKIAFGSLSGKALDPRAPENKVDLDAQIAKAFKALQK